MRKVPCRIWKRFERRSVAGCRWPMALIRSGFTLVEVLIAVAIMAILASVLVPALSDSSASQLRGAALILTRDIEYLQSEAMNTGQALDLEFVSATQYRAVDPDGGTNGSAAVLAHPQSDSPAHGGQFIVDFDDPGPLRGVTVEAQFGVGQRLRFGRFGEAESGGEVIVRVGNRQVRITVAEVTGLVSIGALEPAP